MSARRSELIGASGGNRVLLISVGGESNGVGYGENPSAQVSELGLRSKIFISNENTHVFQPLNIGVNNIFEVAASHGVELFLANRIAQGPIGEFEEVYIVKWAKGGTRIADWVVGGQWWNRAISRIDDALAELHSRGKEVVHIVWWSQGINDVGPTSNADWKAGTITTFQAIRALYGSTLPIIQSKFAQTKFNTNMDEIAALNAFTKVIDITVQRNGDGIHWSYLGLKEEAGPRYLEQSMPFILTA